MPTGHYVCKMKKKIYREDIIQSGYELFYEKGYGATGINEITSKTGIPKGSFYNHFKNKEEFGIIVLDYYIKTDINYLKETILSKERTPLFNLKRYFKEYINKQENELDCSKGCLMGNLSMELADHELNIQKLSSSGFEYLSSIFNHCLRKAKLSGEISSETDTELLANFIVNGWQGAMLRMKADKSTKALKEFYKIIFDQLIN